MDRQRRGEICVILSAILFGMMPLMTRAAYRGGSNALSAAFYRFAFGAAMLFCLVRLSGREKLWPGRARLRKILLFSLPYSVTPMLLYSSYDRIPSGLATTLHFIYPVCVMLISHVVFRERITPRALACGLMGLGGMALMYAPGGRVSGAGILIAALSGLTYAVYIVMLGRSGLDGLSAPVTGFWLSLFSAAVIGAAAMAGGRLAGGFTAAGWLAHLALALTTTVLAIVLFQKGTFLCGPVRASLLSAFEPLTGVLIGLTALGEKLDLRLGTGMALILASVVLLVADRKEKEAGAG